MRRDQSPIKCIKLRAVRVNSNVAGMCFFFKGGGGGVKVGHLPLATPLIRNRPPKNEMEIGCWEGYVSEVGISSRANCALPYCLLLIEMKVRFTLLVRKREGGRKGGK